MITKNPKNVLLADDSEFFRTKLSDILIEAGHSVTFASTGREVIDKVQGDPDGIDLLILDLQKPHVDGFGVLEWMKNNGYNDRFTVLAVTGVYEPGEVIDRLKSLGASSLVTKGFTPEQVIHCINQLLFPEKADERSAPRAGLHRGLLFPSRSTSHSGMRPIPRFCLTSALPGSSCTQP
jgi:CheY-like chemotaxis protein